MQSYLVLALLALLAVSLFNGYRSFRANLATAKQSGLPYIVVPVYMFNFVWLVLGRLIAVPLLERLPRAWTESWLPYTKSHWLWDEGFDPFHKLGSDSFILVTPTINAVIVADPAMIAQITARRNDFPKPVEMYKGINIFGTNLVSAEGALWRLHRKVTSPPFTERSNAIVWQESLLQAQSMMNSWVGESKTSSGRVASIASECMRLSLHVISKAGFGVHLKWPHEETTAVPIAAGHTMTYKNALEEILQNMFIVMLNPSWLLQNSPLAFHKNANRAYIEWGKYMRELYETKKVEIKNGTGPREGLDLMGALMRGAGITHESLNEKSDTPPKQLLTDDEILGNAFVFILAGHETAANTIHFSIVLLAMRMASQIHLQKDLDAILGDRPVSEWDYDQDISKLFGSMCGAVMNEELRLVPPVIGIPKSTPKDQPQVLRTRDGKTVTLPQGAYVTIDSVGTHRNPHVWPHTSYADLTEFRPERWLLDPSALPAHPVADGDTYETEEGLDLEGAGPDKRPDTAASLFRPAKGAYVPFSEGYRSCIGRRFAQVEILAVLAVVFRDWSVELDVSDDLPDAEWDTASDDRKRAAWDKAHARARALFKDGMETLITLQMRKGKVPVRFVKRGTERFRFMVQD